MLLLTLSLKTNLEKANFQLSNNFSIASNVSGVYEDNVAKHFEVSMNVKFHFHNQQL